MKRITCLVAIAVGLLAWAAPAQARAITDSVNSLFMLILTPYRPGNPNEYRTLSNVPR